MRAAGDGERRGGARIEESSSKLNASNETLLISFLRSVHREPDAHRSRAPAFLSVQSRLLAAKKFAALREKKKRRARRRRRRRRDGRRRRETDGEPTLAKRDDIENFGGNRRGAGKMEVVKEEDCWEM